MVTVQTQPARGAELPLSPDGSLPHVVVGDVPIFNGGFEDAVRFCCERIAGGTGGTIATANLDFLAQARRDPLLRELLWSSSLVVADGAPVGWLARRSGAQLVERIAGIDLVQAILAAQMESQPLRVALYGSTDDISLTASNAIERQYPGVTIVARICPPFRELTGDEVLAERQRLQDSAPHLVLVALGCPKQERLIAAYRDAVPAAVWIGVGGSLDFFAGYRQRAPRWLQSIGLEWFVRLLQEPRRLWRRYLLRDVPELFRSYRDCARR